MDWFASDYCGPSANFLYRFNSPVIPGISYFYGNWTDARARQLIVLGDFLAAAWFAAAPASVAVSPMCDSA